MTSLRWFPYLSNRDNKSNFSPCLPSSVAMDRRQVSRAPEGGRANRMRVELEVQGEEGCHSPGSNTARGGNLVRELDNRFVSILGRGQHNSLGVHVRTCGLLIDKF